MCWCASAVCAVLHRAAPSQHLFPRNNSGLEEGGYSLWQASSLWVSLYADKWVKFIFLSFEAFYTCFFHRSVRFRWYQGFFSSGSSPPTWALDNIYIGPQCQDMCNGHGACVGGTHCACDPGYSGSDCSVPDTPNPDFLKEDFEGRLMAILPCKAPPHCFLLAIFLDLQPENSLILISHIYISYLQLLFIWNDLIKSFVVLEF